jgi:hypothetical protein
MVSWSASHVLTGLAIPHALWMVGRFVLPLPEGPPAGAAAQRLHEALDVIELALGGGGLNIVFAAGRELGSCVTPTRVIRGGTPKRPTGLLWDGLSAAKIATIPLFERMARARATADE